MPTFVTFTSDTLTIRPWADEVIDQLGFDPRSSYVERFWLGILGPSTTWLLRRIATGFDDRPDGFELPLAETARSLGLGDRGGRHSPFLRSVNRTIQFGMATAIGTGELLVRRRIPPLARRQIERLPPHLLEGHARWQQTQLSEHLGIDTLSEQATAVNAGWPSVGAMNGTPSVGGGPEKVDRK
jgi:hypothetical protein